MLKTTTASLLISLLLAGCAAGDLGGGAHTGAAARPAGGMMGGATMRGGMEGKGAMPMMQHMRAMDANRDGMVSKAEFLRAHEAMYEAMPKNAAGQLDMASMGGMCPMMGGMHGPGMQQR